MIQNHPQKITKRIVKMYHKRLIEQKIYFKTKNNSTFKKSLLTNAFPELGLYMRCSTSRTKMM